MKVKQNNIAIPSDPNDSEDFDVTYEALEVAKFSRKIRIARHKSGLTQMEFAERFNIPVGTLREWEQARVTPPAYAVKYAEMCATYPELVLEVA